MSIVINTNVPSMMAAHHVRTTRDGLETAMERLSSGKRINNASDDAAGVGMAMRLTAQIRGSEMAMRNVTDALNIMKTADAALVEVENIAARYYELTVQQQTDNVYTTADIANITAEEAQLILELVDISANTKFNTLDIFGEDFDVITSADGSTTTLAVTDFNATPLVAGTSEALVQAYIDDVSAVRGELGSFINRLEYKLNNLSALSANTSQALSSVQDTDYAAESAAVAKFQVLQQAGAAMLAQANASSQYVLTLLQ